MNPTATLLAGLAVTFLLAAAVVGYMRSHLRRLLADISGTRGRADSDSGGGLDKSNFIRSARQ